MGGFLREGVEVSKSSLRFRPRRWPQLADLARKLRKVSPTESGSHVPVDPEEIRGLAEALLQISAGKDAREVFEQRTTKGNSSRSVEALNAAIAYWRARLDDPAADDAPAIRAAKKRYLADPPSDDRIRRIARRYRERALEALEGWEYWLDENLQPQSRCRHDYNTSKLRAHLAKKSEHFKD